MTNPISPWPALILLALILPGCCQDRSPSSPQDLPLSGITLPPLTYAPVSTFEQSCARCHGPQGSFFGKGFAQEDDADLKQTVQDMMEGPSFLTPSPADVQAMTAYLQAMANQQPFLCVTTWDPNSDRLQGEATPGTVVIPVGAEDQHVTANAQGQWTLSGLPARWQGKLQAHWQGKSTTLSLNSQ